MPILFRPRREKAVVVYGKPGCHLCEDVLMALHRHQRRLKLRIQEVDITQDPQLFREYDIRIPVVVIDGEMVLEAPIAEAQLLDALRKGR